MARAYVVPIGYIERQTGEGATFILNNAEDSKTLRTNTPVTVWRYSPEHLALAKIRGLISAVGYVTATFRTVESVIDSRWPEEEEILREKTPLYLALEDSFEPDPERMMTQEQVDRIQSTVPMYRKLRSGDPQNEAGSQRRRPGQIAVNASTSTASRLTKAIHSEKL